MCELESMSPVDDACLITKLDVPALSATNAFGDSHTLVIALGFLMVLV